MKNIKKIFIYAFVFSLTSIGMHAVAASMEDVQKTINENTSALDELMSKPEESIPTDLLHAAKCVASLHIIKAGFIWGGRAGRGVVSCRSKDGNWSNPVFMDIGSGSWGLQIGVEVVDLIMVFTNHNAQQSFEHGNFTLDAAAAVTAGPVGRDLSSGTNYKLEDAIYSYSRAKGLFVGLTLEGSVIKSDDDFNKAAYGVRSPEQIFVETENRPDAVLPFMTALTKYSM